MWASYERNPPSGGTGGDNDGFKSLALWDQQTGDGLVVTTNSDNGLSLCYDLAAELTDADFLAAMAAFIETAE